MTSESDEIVISRDGETLPILDILTGRGFITGKSGSGKSVSTNVILEGLLEQEYPFLIIDTDGEYWGLKELYQVLHVGASDQCDVQVDSSNAEIIVDVALDGQPVILDVSGYLRAEDATDLIEAVLTHLFRKEKQRRKPFLLVAEEVHEYIPQQSGFGDVGEVLIQIAKRGRKHGLGILGISQRPAAVDKDFITQCDWIVWHRLTWKNDTDVVAGILGDEPADEVEEFDPGEAYLMADWESELKRIRFTMKESYDAGATPGLETPDPPPLMALDEAVLQRFDTSRAEAADGKRHGADGSAADEETTDDGSTEAGAGTGEAGQEDTGSPETGTGSIVSTEPVDPSDLSDPSAQSDPSAPLDQSDQSDPLDPSDPAGSADPADSTGRAEPGNTSPTPERPAATDSADSTAGPGVPDASGGRGDPDPLEPASVRKVDDRTSGGRQREERSRTRTRRKRVEPTGPDSTPDEEPVAFAVEFTNLFVYAFRVIVVTVSDTVTRIQHWVWGENSSDAVHSRSRSATTLSHRAKYLLALTFALLLGLTAMVLFGG